MDEGLTLKVHPELVATLTSKQIVWELKQIKILNP